MSRDFAKAWIRSLLRWQLQWHRSDRVVCYAQISVEVEEGRERQREGKGRVCSRSLPLQLIDLFRSRERGTMNFPAMLTQTNCRASVKVGNSRDSHRCILPPRDRDRPCDRRWQDFSLGRKTQRGWLTRIRFFF